MKHLLLIFGFLVLTGCEGIQMYEKGNLVSLGTGALAGVTTYALADNLDDTDRALLAAGVGGATYLVSEFIRGQIKADDIKHFNNGYDLGRSDAIKNQYWAIQNLQKPGNTEPKPTYRIYTFPGKKQHNGVNFDAHEIRVRMEE